MDNFVRDNALKLHQHSRDFKRIFGTDLHLYFDIFTGFDVVKFDEVFIKPPKGTSTKDAVLSKYGKDGVKICMMLIGGSHD